MRVCLGRECAQQDKGKIKVETSEKLYLRTTNPTLLQFLMISNS